MACSCEKWTIGLINVKLHYRDLFDDESREFKKLFTQNMCFSEALAASKRFRCHKHIAIYPLNTKSFYLLADDKRFSIHTAFPIPGHVILGRSIVIDYTQGRFTLDVIRDHSFRSFHSINIPLTKCVFETISKVIQTKTSELYVQYWVNRLSSQYVMLNETFMEPILDPFVCMFHIMTVRRHDGFMLRFKLDLQSRILLDNTMQKQDSKNDEFIPNLKHVLTEIRQNRETGFRILNEKDAVSTNQVIFSNMVPEDVIWKNLRYKFKKVE